MKRLILYWITISVPFLILVFLIDNDLMTYSDVLISLFLYYLFRVFTVGSRLVSLGKIGKADIWRLLIPHYRYKFSRSLYFEAR